MEEEEHLEEEGGVPVGVGAEAEEHGEHVQAHLVVVVVVVGRGEALDEKLNILPRPKT